MPAPTGGRAHAFYGEEHFEAIKRYLKLRQLGFSPASIRVLLEAKTGVPFPVRDGITLVVPPELVASGIPVEPLMKTIRQTLQEIVERNEDEDDDE